MFKRTYAIIVIVVSLLVLSACGSPPVIQQNDGGAIIVQPDTPYAVEQPIVGEVDALCQGYSKVVNDVNFSLLTLPRWIRSAFRNSGWQLKVVDYDLATVDYEGEFAEGDVLGSTAYRDREIRILDEPKAAINAPIHEFGHWLDWYLGYPTMSDEEYLLIYNEEQEQYRSSFGPTCSWSEQEFFAEGFWCYWKSPESLKKVCPQFHGYLANKLAEIKAAQ